MRLSALERGVGMAGENLMERRLRVGALATLTLALLVGLGACSGDDEPNAADLPRILTADQLNDEIVEPATGCTDFSSSPNEQSADTSSFGYCELPVSDPDTSDSSDSLKLEVWSTEDARLQDDERPWNYGTCDTLDAKDADVYPVGEELYVVHENWAVYARRTPASLLARETGAELLYCDD